MPATIKDANIKGKIVLIRVDYNVPMKDGEIVDDLRIRASLPTLNYLIDHGAKKLILISHLGRPEGRDQSLSLKPIADHLAKLLPERSVSFINDVSGPDVEDAVKSTEQGGILMMENLRFFAGEKNNSSDFAREIIESTHANFFVQDGFAVMHRAHASTSALPHELPSAIGLLVEKEVENLSKLTNNPKRPFLAIIGGAKVEDKQPLIERFCDLADNIVVGGKIAADGYTSTNEKIYVAEDFNEDETGAKLDIGIASVRKIIALIEKAETILWNGTLGYAEKRGFDVASAAVAEAIGEKTSATTVIAGGDTTGFVENHPFYKDGTLRYSLVSTGGGATLEFLTSGTLPGLEALED